MTFKSYNSNSIDLNIHYNQQKLDIVNNFKFLGITIDENLNWKEHVNEICKKLDRYVYALYRLRQTVSLEAALAAYHGYVSSVLGYGLVMWGGSVVRDRVFRIQKKCIRAVSNAGYLDSCRPLFKQLNILPLPCMYIRDTCCFIKQYPHYFKMYTETTSRHVRSQYTHLLHQPPSRTMIYEKNAYNMCIELYNKLPTSLKITKTSMFRRSLTEWLAERCFYCVNDFLKA